MFKKIFKGKRGSEIVQNLIVIAIMGALAITAIGFISNTLKDKNKTIVESIKTDLDTEYEKSSAPIN